MAASMRACCRVHRAALLGSAAIGLVLSLGTGRATAADGGRAFDGVGALGATGGGKAGGALAGGGGNYGQRGAGPTGGDAGADGTTTPTLNNDAPFAGGPGFDGGTSGTTGIDTGDGGGAGGAGAVVTGSAAGSNSSSVFGGVGGIGGFADQAAIMGISAGDFVNQAGGGGAGGSGLIFSANGASFTNSGAVLGGAGGTGGLSSLALIVQTNDGGAFVSGGGGGAGGTGAIFFGAFASLNDTGGFEGGGGGAGGNAGLTIVSSTLSGSISLSSGSGGQGGAGLVFAGQSALARVSGSMGGAGGDGGALDIGAVGNGFVSSLSVSGNGGGGGAGLILSGAQGRIFALGAISGGAGGAGGKIDNGFVGNLSTTSLITQSGDGGAGGHGILASGDGAQVSNQMLLVGGRGGDGGNTQNVVIVGNTVGALAARGGNGGAGGAGLIVNGNAATLTNAGSLFGGNGGNGGIVGNIILDTTISSITEQGGNGGAGGIGAAFFGSGARITNTGAIGGGNGGGGGISGGTAGTGGIGGVGLLGAGLIIDNAGSISGGLDDGGAGPRAFAIVLTGGGNAVGGAGTILGGIDVQGASVFAPALPGSAVGNPLAIDGPLRFSPAATYQVRLSGAASDRTDVTGIASLNNAGVRVLPDAAALGLRQQRYTLLTAANGVSGTFDVLDAPRSIFSAYTLAYDANTVFLDYARTPFASFAQNRNQNAVAGTLDTLSLSNPIVQAVFAQQNAADVRRAFDALSGEVYSSAITAGMQTAFLVQEAILDHMRFGESNGFGAGLTGSVGQRFAPGTTLPAMYTADLPGRRAVVGAVPLAPVQPNYAVWGQGFGSFGKTGGDGNAAHLARQISGFVAGIETGSGILGGGLSDWRAGVAAGYTFTSFDVSARQSSGQIESGFGAVYARGPLGPLQLRLGATYADNSFDTRRAVAIPGFSQSLRGKNGGETIQGFGELGYRFSLGGYGATYLEPFVGGASVHLGRSGFEETGGSAALRVFGRDYDVQTVTSGAQGQFVVADLFWGAGPLVARGMLGYRRAFGDILPSTLLAFAGGGQSFTTSGVPIARDALVASAGLDWQIRPNTAIGIAYTGQVGPRAEDHAVKGGFNLRW